MEIPFDASQLSQRLAETSAWCAHRLALSIAERGQWKYQSDRNLDAPEMTLPEDLKGCLRSEELKPSYFFNYHAEEHLQHQNAYRFNAVETLALRRADLVREQKLPAIAGGRILAFAPDSSLWDGPSGGETDGYIEGTYDVPPWDS